MRPIISPSLFQLLFACLLLLIRPAGAQPFARVCGISELAPVFSAAYDEESRDFVLVPEYGDSGNFIHHVDFNRSNLQQESHNSTTNTLVRECPCAREVYCPLDLDTCGVPVEYSQPVGCFAKSTQKTLLRNAWPLLLLWYSTLLFFLLCTEKGRNARHFLMLKTCQPQHNERMVDRFLFTHGLLATNPFEGEQGDRAQQPLDWLPVATPIQPPTELVLKTRLYEPPPPPDMSEQDEDEEEEPTCTICFAPLQEGDRVGKLSNCDHTFHVDCLREWLPRRNVCPLCQTANAATPRYGTQEDENDHPEAEGDVELAPIDAVQEDPPRAAARPRRRPFLRFAVPRIGGRN